MKKYESLEERSRKADQRGLSYGKYEQYLYREECLKKRKKEGKNHKKSKDAT